MLGRSPLISWRYRVILDWCGFCGVLYRGGVIVLIIVLMVPVVSVVLPLIRDLVLSWLVH